MIKPMAPIRKTRLRVLRGQDVPDAGRGRAALMTLVRVFGRLSETMSQTVKPFGLGMAQFEVLASLRGAEGASQQDLADRLLVTKGNICVTLQKMEADGLVERRADPTDQRYHRIYLTDAGKRLLTRMLPAQEAAMSKIIGCLDRAEQKTLYELLNRIDQQFDDLSM
jgi:MarR family transcriptional regulator, organic hydroperoxide resistance regulator